MALFDAKTLAFAFEQIESERGITRNQLVLAIGKALASAYKKEYGKVGQIVDAVFDPNTGEAEFEQVKIVVEQAIGNEEGIVDVNEEEPVVYNSEKHIMLSDAKKIKSDAVVGSEIRFPLPYKSDFGRIAAQTAKQVIKQKLREAERVVVMNTYHGREGDIVTGTVRRFEKRNVYIDLEKTIAILPYSEQIIGERYRQGEFVRAYILKVQEDAKGGGFVTLSRTNPEFVKKLFARESPEIANGSVVIKKIAREPGKRTKLAVESSEEYLDPVGALVGQRGVRVSTVSSELRGERIDVIPYTSKADVFIEEALQPAQVVNVEVDEQNKTAKAFVRDDQVPLAIGNRGLNIRLATELTGYEIDVISIDKKDIDESDADAEKNEEQTNIPEILSDDNTNEENTETKSEKTINSEKIT